MRERLSRSRVSVSHLKLLEASQSDIIAGKKTLAAALPSCEEEEGLAAQDASPPNSTTPKRPLDDAGLIDGPPAAAKRTRRTCTETDRRPPRRSPRLKTRPRPRPRPRRQQSTLTGGAEDSDQLLLQSAAAGKPPPAPERARSPRTRPPRRRRRTAENKAVAKTSKAREIQPKTELEEQVPTPPVTVRKQQTAAATAAAATDDDNEEGGHNGVQLKRVRLTRKNLARFRKMVKKRVSSKTTSSLSSSLSSSSAASRSTAGSGSTKTTSTTASGFAILAYKNGILNSRLSKPPSNIEDMHKRRVESRRSASPTESEYNHYVKKVEGARNEMTLLVETSGKLLKDYNEDGYNRVFNQAFTGFPKDIGLNNNLSAPQPDYIEGLEMQEYRPLPVDDHIKGAVLYKDDPSSLTLPLLAGEWKSRGKDMEEAKLQSAYDGAALVYARNQALSYLGKSDPPGHAEVTTFTTDGTNLNLFAHYATLFADGTPEYHQYPIKSTNLTDSHQAFRDGRRGLRNVQDHARKQAYCMRDHLRERWKRRRGGGAAGHQTVGRRTSSTRRRQ